MQRSGDAVLNSQVAPGGAGAAISEDHADKSHHRQAALGQLRKGEGVWWWWCWWTMIVLAIDDDNENEFLEACRSVHRLRTKIETV